MPTYRVSQTLADEVLMPIIRQKVQELQTKHLQNFTEEMRRALLQLTAEFVWELEPHTVDTYRLAIVVPEPTK